MKTTRRDAKIRLMAMRYMVKQLRKERCIPPAYEQCDKVKTLEHGIAGFYAQRHHIAYDNAIMPCPIWIA
jgi:hypothetical protein